MRPSSAAPSVTLLRLPPALLTRVAGILALALVGGFLVAVPPAVAAPGITLAKTASPTVRAGEPITYTLTAANPSSNPDAVDEWNLSFRDVLPAGVTYVPGSTSPAGAGEPTVVTTGSGTTLVWPNVADLQVGSTYAITFRATPSATSYPVGATVPNAANAYTNSDPQVSPDFSPTGTVVPGSFTATAAATASTLVSALEVTKSEGSPEGELLRGVHDHPTVYTLTVRGTAAGASSGLVVTDLLPAGLEFLGCSGVDNSSAPEYPGAPPLTATPVVPDCRAPDSVSTVVNPPPANGVTFPPGTYTRLSWTIGALPAGGSVTLRYAAGIPLRANVATWPGTTPSPTSGRQAANLDNNTGASSREGVGETGLRNAASATATYSGVVAPGGTTAVSASDTETVSVEDVRARKSASPTEFRAGAVVRYTVTVDTSEYVSASGVVVTDTIPNGVCPLGPPGTNYTQTGLPACAGLGDGSTTPSSAFDSVTQNADGTFTVVFAPQTAGRDGTITYSYAARMLSSYLGGPVAGQPTAVGDSFTNQVALTATTTPIPGTGESGPATVGDTSSATLTSGGATLAKTVLPRSLTGPTCPTDGALYRDPDTLPAAETLFRLGDVVCYRLRVDYSDLARTRNATLTDVLPMGLTSDVDLVVPTPANTAPFTPLGPAGRLSFAIGRDGPGGRFVEPGGVTELVFPATVTAVPPSGTTAVTRDNLLKVGFQDTAGNRQSLRDAAAVRLAPAPAVGVVKGVQRVDVPASGPNGPNSNVDGSLVQGGSTATFRIDVTHRGTGDTAAPIGGLDVWDVLPAGLTCAAVTNVRVDSTAASTLTAAPQTTGTDPGDPDQPGFSGSDTLSLLRLVWPLTGDVAAQQLPAGGRVTILYDLAIPSPAPIGTVYPDTAAVHRFSQVTDITAETGTLATYYPASNIATTLPPGAQRAPAAANGSSVRVRSPVVTKTGTTSIEETGNNRPFEATVGERVTYTYAVTVPARTEVFAGVLTDTLPAGFVVDPATPAVLSFQPDAASTATAPVPDGVVLDPATGRVTFPAEYRNPSATDQRFAVTITVRVASAALPLGQTDLARTNTARFASLATAGGAPNPAVTATYEIRVRQPNPGITKEDDAAGAVAAGSLVTYTVTAVNRTAGGTGTGLTPLHDAFVVDCVPAGLAFEAYGPDPGSAPVPGDGTNGCATGTTRLVWSLGDVAPGAAVTRTYTVRVPVGTVGGQTYRNTARLTGSTLDDGSTDPLATLNPDERGYAVTDSNDLTVIGAAVVTKTVDPDRATIGQRVTFTVTDVIPANITLYDSALIDRAPPGITGLRLESISCSTIGRDTPCGFLASGTQLTPVPQPDGSTLTGYGLGDIPASPDRRAVVLTYSGVVADTAVNTAGRVARNVALPKWNLTDGRTPTRADDAFDRSGDSASAALTVVEPSLTIAKAVSDPAPGPGDLFTYTLTVTNSNAANASTAYSIDLSDLVPRGVVVDPASITGGGVLVGGTPLGGGTVQWRGLLGADGLAPGETGELTYTARLAASTSLTGAGLTNTASVVRYRSLPPGQGEPAGGRTYASPSARATVTPDFPRIETAKVALDPAPAYIGEPYTWQVTVRNTGAAPAFGVDVLDVLPVNWSYVTGSATVSVAGGPPTEVEPIVTLTTLRWIDLGRLNPGESLVVTYRSVPGPGVVGQPGVGATVLHVNSAQGTGVDATGASGNANGSYSRPTVQASTRIDSADLVLDKTHTGDVVAGRPLTWTVQVRNAGPDTAVGPFTVTDTLPAGVDLVSASGTGWSCAPDGRTVTCTRLDAAATLAAGASLPDIAVRVSVPADTADGTELTNAATVDGRTYDPQEANNADADTATVTTAADLSIAKSHALDPVAGQVMTWTLDVVNGGPSFSAPPVTVRDTLPEGTTYVAASGEGWDCTGSGRDVTCTRDTALPLGPAPQVTVAADVASSVTGTITNSATVTPGPTADPDDGNNTAVDPSPVTTLADLSVEKVHEGEFVAGSSAAYRFTVVNSGPSDAAGPVRLADTLPQGITYSAIDGAADGWACTSQGADLTCERAAGLPAGETTSLRVLVDVDPALVVPPGDGIRNTVRVSSPTDDPNPANDTDDDLTGVDRRADLRIDKAHDPDQLVVAGATATWSLTVTNGGPSDTDGPLVVTDPVPEGTAYVSAEGDGWDCGEADRLVTCTRAAGLAAGDQAPAITLTLRVDPSAGPGVLRNSADVAGPLADPDPANNTDSDDVTVVDRADLAVSKSVVGDSTVVAGATVQYDLTVSNAGPSDADAVTLVDTAPEGLVPTAVDAPAGWECTVSAPEVRCTRPTLAGPATDEPTRTTIRVTARVTASVPEGTTLRNEVVVATSTPGDDPADNTDDATVDVVARADLRLEKSHDAEQDPVVAGTQATFTLAVTNDGPSDAVGPLTVTDLLPLGLSFVSANAPWACQTDPPESQVVSCTLDVERLPADGSAPVLRLTVAVAADATAGTYTNEATVTSPTTDPRPSNNRDSDDLPVVERVDLAVVKTHAGPVRVGDDLTFDLAVTNRGPSLAREVRLTDTLPTGLDPVSAAGDGWACEVTGRTVTCTREAPLPPGEDAPPVTLTTTVRPAAYPSVDNTTEVTSSTPETDPDDNSSTDTVVVPPQVDLSVSKSHSGPAVVGEELRSRLEVANAGPTPDPGPLTVTDDLPAGTTFVAASGEGWQCSAAGQRVSCTSAAGLAVGGRTRIELRVALTPAAYPAVTNSATVLSPAEDVDPENNTGTATAPVTPVSRLTVTKDVLAAPAGRAGFTIRVRNEGPSPTTAPVVVTDTLPAGLSYVSARGDGWACVPAGASVTCTYAASLAVGAGAPAITVETTVSGRPGATLTNLASVTGGSVSPCPDCGDTDDAAVTVPTAPPVVGPGGGGGAAGGPGGGGLAFTGAEVLLLLALALGLLLAGSGGVALSRRRSG
ncbi:MAG TPA: hypothetical protein VES95_13735 [Dermatophilaceae bacterium]|nr:hypothetical protein [Dermatophilaceae bacterium]